MTLSLQQTRLGINLPLTNLAQGVKQPEYVMRLLYPMVEVGTYGGQIIRFDESDYEEVDDARADDTFYPEIQDGYKGEPFNLITRGLSYRVGDKKAKEMQNLRINWGQRASNKLMKRAGLMHEIRAALAATTVANYATANRVTLDGTTQFTTADVDPGPVIRAGRSAIAAQIGVDPNVMLMGRDVLDGLAENAAVKDFMKHTSRDSLTPDILAARYGFDRVAVCNAIVKRGGVKSRVFGKHIVMAYINPAALGQDRLPYRPNGAIDNEEPSFGYTYTYTNNPLMYNPYYDNDRGATVYKLDFDYSIAQTGVDESSKITHGYLIANSVA